MSEDNMQKPKIFRRILTSTLTTLKLLPKTDGKAVSVTSRTTKKLSSTSSNHGPTLESRHKVSKIQGTAISSTSRTYTRTISMVEPSNQDRSTSYIYDPSSSSFISTSDDLDHRYHHSYFPPLRDHMDYGPYNYVPPLMKRNEADPYMIRPLIDSDDQYFQPRKDHKNYDDLCECDSPLMERNDAHNPYIRPLSNDRDQLFHTYDDDDDQYFTPRSSTDHKDFGNTFVPPLIKQNDYEDKIFPISDDQKYAEQLQLEEALQFSSSSSKLPIHSSKLPERSCNICMDTKTESEMFHNTNVCGHMFCFDCIREHVAVKIKENMVNVRCPDPSCKGLIRPEVCRFFVPREVIIRWEKALCESMIIGSQKFYCPFNDCSALLVDDGRQRVTSSECPYCNRLFCAQCKVAWHAGMDCKQFEMVSKGKVDRTDILLMNLAKTKNWRACPKCKFYVEKTEGCLHISCRCKYEFCYGCGMKYHKHHQCPPAARMRIV